MSRVLVAALCLATAGCDATFGLDHFAARTDAPARTGPVASYSMDDLGLSGTVLADATGNHPGSCASCPAPAMGVVRGALEFIEQNRIEVPGGGDLESTAGITVEAWLRVDGLQLDAYGCPLNKQYGIDGGDTWQLCIAGDLELVFITQGQPAAQDLLSGPDHVLALGEWMHVAVREDAGGTRTIAMGGTPVASDQVAPAAYDGGAIELGADATVETIDAPFMGTIDEVRIFARALDPDELAAGTQ